MASDRGGGAKAVVTGHSRGLGAAIAASLLQRGVPVLGIARGVNPDLAAGHGTLAQQQLDLADADMVRAWLESGALGRFFADAPVALLVNNAGLLQPIGPLDVQDLPAVSRAVTLNVAAPLMFSAAFAAATSAASDRRILHISSGAGRKPHAGWSVYCATKAALDHHARTIALDGTPNLRVCSLAPGPIDTAMQGEIRETPDEHFPERARFVELKREGKLKDPDETGRSIAEFLLSADFGGDPVAELRGR